jgi:hypothetical protein
MENRKWKLETRSWKSVMPPAAARNHENARSALECGSLLPLSTRPACGPCAGCWSSDDASKLARQKRQQAAALQSAFGATIFRAVVFDFPISNFHFPVSIFQFPF